MLEEKYLNYLRHESNSIDQSDNSEIRHRLEYLIIYSLNAFPGEFSAEAGKSNFLFGQRHRAKAKYIINN